MWRREESGDGDAKLLVVVVADGLSGVVGGIRGRGLEGFGSCSGIGGRVDGVDWEGVKPAVE